MNYKIPELLAPVGKTENLYAAIDGGADSIYLGGNNFNARKKATNFSISDLYTIKKIVNKADKKWFIVLNTLVRERELPELYRYLQILEHLKPTGIIIQDLGVLNMIKTKTKIIQKGIELHGSTQLSTFNSLSIKTLSNLGFNRVVPDRHLTIDEIKLIKKAVPNMEIEIFIHGAMCYSLSGSCYFSSYLGGMSANRGLCAQVCRRAFNFKDKKGYLFSLSDLNSIDLMDKIVKAKVDALKIEGRMKSPNFVYKVTKEYRYLLDNIENFDQIKDEVKDRLSEVVTRRETAGFYISKSPEKITEPFSSGVYGKLIGKVIKQKGKTLKIKLFQDLEAGSRVRVHCYENDKTVTQKVKNVLIKGEIYPKGLKGDVIDITVPDNYIFKTGNLYLIENKAEKKWPSKLKPAAKHKKINLKNYKSLPYKDSGKVNNFKYYIKVPSFDKISLFSNWKNSFFILPLNEKNLSFFNKNRDIYYSIPQTIFENKVQYWEEIVNKALKEGVKKFEINSLATLNLISKIVNKKGVSLISSPKINVLNQETLLQFKNMGVSQSVLSYEVTKDEIEKLSKISIKDQIVIPLYSKIDLFISRAPHPLLNKKGEQLYSQKGEKFIFKQDDQLSLTFSDKDFSLTKRLNQLKNMGWSDFYIDLENIYINKNFVNKLYNGIKNGKEMKNTTAFNYFLDLK